MTSSSWQARLLAPALLALAGCATIVSGSKQKITFNSAPVGATVTLDSAAAGVTPVEVALARKTEHQVRIELQGYRPYTLKLEKKLNGWFIGNIAFGGLIGLVVDGTTGAMYKLSPAQVDARLDRQVAVRHDRNLLVVLVTLHPVVGAEQVAQLERKGD